MKSAIPLVTSLALLLQASMQAAVVYFDDFSGLATNELRGTTPDTGGNTWLGTNNFKADGSVTTGAGSITLPFSPAAGFVYTLSANISFTTNDASWIGLGFADASATWTGTPATGNGNRFTGAVIAGYSWMITAPTTGQSGFRGSGGTNAATETGFTDVLSSTVILTLTLDTTATNWQTSYYVNSALLGTTVAVGSQPIDSVGLSVFSGALGKVSNFQLTSVVPEPSAMLLGGMVLLGLLRRSRRACMPQ